MSDLLPIISGIRLEMELMNRSLAQMTKTHAQVISEEWITPEQVKAILKISNRTLETLKKNKQLPYSKVNGLVYFRTVDLEHLLKEHYVASTSSNNNHLFKKRRERWPIII